jgi:hypothetical protein
MTIGYMHLNVRRLSAWGTIFDDLLQIIYSEFFFEEIRYADTAHVEENREVCLIETYNIRNYIL